MFLGLTALGQCAYYLYSDRAEQNEQSVPLTEDGGQISPKGSFPFKPAVGSYSGD